jgi:hypothetical protein
MPKEVEEWLHSPDVRARLAEDLRAWSGRLSPETLATNLVVGLVASWRRCSSGLLAKQSGGPSVPSGGSGAGGHAVLGVTDPSGPGVGST